MKKLLLETSFSKIYMIVMILITLLILGGYFSYAMFTVSKEKSNAISIVTGNLTYKLEVDGEEANELVVPANTTKEFIVTLSNPNNRITRFNFYYIETIPNGVIAGHVVEEGVNTLPSETGINLEASGTSGSSNTYLIRVTNTTSSNITINLGVSVGLDYNDLTLPSNGHLFEEYEGIELATLLKMDINNNIDTTDSEQTFITGSDPNNYIWYSGKLWRAVSIDPSDNSIKLTTQWNATAIAYNEEGNSSFDGSHMKMWLNDETTDGFLGNLRDAENFIKMASTWNATLDNRDFEDITTPDKKVMITTAVGLLNSYEYKKSGCTKTFGGCYLDTGQAWFLITPISSDSLASLGGGGYSYTSSQNAGGTRPAINLKRGIKAVDGTGTETDPYRLEGDNDTNLNKTLLNTRYSGEYVSFGSGENSLYKIVSHETPGLTKITSAYPLKTNGKYLTSVYGNNITFLNSTIYNFLNNDYLNPSNGYLTSEEVNMIEDNTTWYLGVFDYGNNYRLTKYTDINMSSYNSRTTTAKIGMFRIGEIIETPYFDGDNTNNFFLLSAYNTQIHQMNYQGYINRTYSTNTNNIKPVMNLKENVIITSGEGTKENPFQIELESTS